jgi:hypothetical protein
VPGDRRGAKKKEHAISPAATRKLGGLAEHAGRTVRDMIRERGGRAGNVRATGHWADRTLEEAAEAAVRGDKTAETAIKIVKQARRLGEEA